MNRQKRYSDGTLILSPFYVCRCQNGHNYWSVTKQEKCSRCGADLKLIPADKKRATNCN